MANLSDGAHVKVVNAGCIMLWMILSAFVILLNKFILATVFPYPVTLTVIHMFVCSAIAGLLVTAGFAGDVEMEWTTYIRSIPPIALLFCGTLWMGNAAYMYLSIAFIQMLKGAMPIAVFAVGIALGIETYHHYTLLNLVVIGAGVVIASYGELNFDLVGVLLQCASLCTESFRLALIQLLLQNRGVKLNPLSTLHYVAPACLAFMLAPLYVVEVPLLLQLHKIPANPLLLLGSGLSAFALNMSVFLLIGRTSALTMNIAGVMKDWMLIAVSISLFKSPVTVTQLSGYAISFAGICWYNHSKQTNTGEHGK